MNIQGKNTQEIFRHLWEGYLGKFCNLHLSKGSQTSKNLQNTFVLFSPTKLLQILWNLIYMYLICSHYITNKMACNRILFIFPQQDTFHMSTTGYFAYFHHRILFIFPQQDTLLSVQSCSITSIQSGTSPSIVPENEAGEEKQGSGDVCHHPSKTIENNIKN